ncbi:MAG: hypothetical protein HC806_08250 [Anaerolineae bacterium]|nr:hypothetical protein [Anaerolineae bacterium]
MKSSIPSTPSENLEKDPTLKREYVKPAIIHELELETRAGSPLGIDPFEDATGVFGTDSYDPEFNFRTSRKPGPSFRLSFH